MNKKSIREMVLNNMKVEMSIPQYCAYQRGELTLEQIVDYNLAEKNVEMWLKNPQVFKKATLIMALLLTVEQKCLAMSTTLEQALTPIERMKVLVDKVMEIVTIIQMVGFIICLIMGLIEMIRAIINKDLSSIISIGIKYFIGLTAILVFPFALKMVFELLGVGGGGILW